MLSNKDIEFLAELKEKLNTQETDCQADPRFWVVAERKRIWGIEDGYEDGVGLIDIEGDVIVAGGLREAKDYVQETYGEDLADDQLECLNDECGSLDDVAQFLEDRGYLGYTVGRYKDHHTIAENTFFLTKDACKKHIESNGYHYTKPHTYAMTAWRSPEVERLFKIIKETDWSKYAVEA